MFPRCASHLLTTLNKSFLYNSEGPFIVYQVLCGVLAQECKQTDLVLSRWQCRLWWYMQAVLPPLFILSEVKGQAWDKHELPLSNSH